MERVITPRTVASYDPGGPIVEASGPGRGRARRGGPGVGGAARGGGDPHGRVLGRGGRPPHLVRRVGEVAPVGQPPAVVVAGEVAEVVHQSSISSRWRSRSSRRS